MILTSPVGIVNQWIDLIDFIDAFSPRRIPKMKRLVRHEHEKKCSQHIRMTVVRINLFRSKIE